MQTLVFLIDRDNRKILLAMKKHGFGVGKWNGTGGHIEEGESPEACAARETQEEIDAVVQQRDLIKVADIKFNFLQHPDWAVHCHTYIAYQWEGEPAESEEMAPQWFNINDIPYEKMLIDDKYWLPAVLDGQIVDAEFFFNGDGESVARYTINGRHQD